VAPQSGAKEKKNCTVYKITSYQTALRASKNLEKKNAEDRVGRQK
jgi:hypothetical protein